MTPRSFKLALVQMRIEPGRPEQNLERALRLTEQAAQNGAGVILLPEALPFGWTDPSARAAEPIPHGRHFQHFREAALKHRIHLCTGLVERDGEKICNSAVLIGPDGELLLHHRKIHELSIAHHLYALGDRLAVAEWPFGRVGLMICADGFAPGQVIARTLALMGAQVILSPGAWAVPATHDNQREPYGSLWLENYGAVARDYPIWIAACSNVGPVSTGPWAGRKCIGCSMVIAPGGRLHVQAGYGDDAEQILYTSILPCEVSRCGPKE